MSRLSGKILTIIGALLILAGILCNQWLLVGLFDPDGAIDSGTNLAVLWLAQIVMIVAGMYIIRNRNVRITPGIWLRVILVIILAFLLGELILRTGIVMGIPFFRNPDLYADWSSSDDYWKLGSLWYPAEPMESGGVDAWLGWRPQVTEENPLGVAAGAAQLAPTNHPAILFYGDSFVYGVTQVSQRIPQQLEKLISGKKVYNYGVPGYGLDQMFLRFMETYSGFKRPSVIFGMLTTDIDRCVLKVRIAQKPYFVISDNNLLLQGVPVNPDFPQWLKSHPPQIKSYLWSALAVKLHVIAEEMGIAPSLRQKEKEAVAGLIIEEISKEAQVNDVPVLFVIFYPQQEIYKVKWREEFLKETLEQWRIPYIDTKILFLDAALSSEVEVRDFYLPDGHLSPQGNAVVAQAIADYFKYQ